MIFCVRVRSFLLPASLNSLPGSIPCRDRLPSQIHDSRFPIKKLLFSACSVYSVYLLCVFSVYSVSSLSSLSCSWYVLSKVRRSLPPSFFSFAPTAEHSRAHHTTDSTAQASTTFHCHLICSTSRQNMEGFLPLPPRTIACPFPSTTLISHPIPRGNYVLGKVRLRLRLRLRLCDFCLFSFLLVSSSSRLLVSVQVSIERITIPSLLPEIPQLICHYRRDSVTPCLLLTL